MQLYRSAIGLKALAGRVDRAFLGDQRVMQEFLIKSVSTTVPSPGGDRGIVIPAGGVDQLANAFINIYVLRHHIGCTLPITLAYWGTLDREAIEAATVEFFNSHLADVTFLDLSEIGYPAHQRWLFPPIPDGSYVGFKVKVFALYAAPYKEVLVIDSDSMLLLDPSPMFDLPEYKKYGNAFWPDRWCTPVKLFDKLGMDDGNGTRLQADSGQFLFDRSRHHTVLEWILFLNTHNEFTYRYAHGDKDTFRVAFNLADKADEYYQVGQPLSVALQPGVLGATARGFVQHHPNGSVAFVHRTSEAKYKAHSSEARGFSRLLLQPSCEWNQRHWHFFSPSVGRRISQVWREARCQFTLWNPQSAADTCGDGGGAKDKKSSEKNSEEQQQQQLPPVLEVAHNSFVWRAQVAADAALLIFKAHVDGNPGLYPRRPGNSLMGKVVILTAVGAGVWSALRCVLILKRRRQWTLVPSSSSSSP